MIKGISLPNILNLHTIFGEKNYAARGAAAHTN